MVYFFSIFLGVSVNNWASVWVFLEFNLMAFIIFLFEYWKIFIEFLMKYFMIQSIFSLAVLSLFFMEGPVYLIFLAKMGACPFHFWLTNSMQFFSEALLVMVLGFQKFILIFLVFYFSFMLEIFILMNMVMSAYFLMFTLNIENMFFISSFMYLSWLLLLMMISMKLFFIFFVNYIILFMTGLLYKTKMKVWVFLGYSSLPFSPLFFVKWSLISFLSSSFVLSSFVLSSFVFYIYLRNLFFMGMKQFFKIQYQKFEALFVVPFLMLYLFI